MNSGLVFNLQRFSVHDGPGIRTTVFMQGCPLRCAWCHNPEGQAARPRVVRVETRCIQCGECHAAVDGAGQVAACPTGARRWQGESWTADALVTELLRDRMFFEESGGGVTIGGGEPLGQPRFVGEVLSRLRAHGIHTALDTCGEADARTLHEVAGQADLVLYDLKHMDPAAHHAWTGVDNGRILANLRSLARRHPRIWIRVPLVPGVNDDPDHLARLAAFVAEAGVRRLHLLPYHAAGTIKFDRVGEPCRLRELPPPDEALLERASRPFLERRLELHIGG